MNMKKAFTFVELIVVVTILGILSTLWFISYTSGLWDARDSTRKSDIASIKSALKQYKQSRGSYPIPSPGDNFNLTVTGSINVATQWKLNNNVTLSTLDNIPTDPKAKVHYMYSITSNRQEYQLAATLENEDTSLALVDGDYSSVAKNTLPTIVVASAVAVDVTSGSNPNLFIFDNQYHNLPYDFTGDGTPSSDGSQTLAELLAQAETDWVFWQNSDIVSCTEIEEAGKDI